MLFNNNNNNNIYTTPTEQSRLSNNNNNINNYGADNLDDIEEDNDNDNLLPSITTATKSKSNIKCSSIYNILTSLIKRTINDDLITLETKKL